MNTKKNAAASECRQHRDKGAETPLKSTTGDKSDKEALAMQNADTCHFCPFNADWLKYDPEAYGRLRLYQANLTQEQRDQIFDAARHFVHRHGDLSSYCTPANAQWIFAVVDKVVQELREPDAFGMTFEPAALCAFLLTIEFEAIYLHGPNVLYVALRTKLNIWYDASPELLKVALSALDGMPELPTVEDIKSRAMSVYSAWGSPCCDYAAELI